MTQHHRRLVVALILATGASVAAAQSQPRFDEQVRADFFAGFSGDEARFAKAMKLCEDTLAKQPRHAEAMVWHGSGQLYLAGRAYGQGDIAQGMRLWEAGLKEMNDAVALQPDNAAVLIPRGATFFETSKYVPSTDQQKSLLEQGVADYEKALTLFASGFSSLPVDMKGELLIGVADGWDRLGDKVKARRYYERVVKECPNSTYAERAAKWLRM